MTASALCNEKVTITFTDTNVSEDGYEVLRATSANGPFNPVGSVSQSIPGDTVTFVDRASATNPLAVNATYFYQVRAYRDDFKGPASTPVAVTTTSPDTANSDLTLNGSALFVSVPSSVDDDMQAIRLSDNINGQTGGVFRTQGRPVNRDFTTSFTFQIPEASGNPADGFMFVIQSNSARALGSGGGGLGFAGIPNSVGIKFDTYSPGGPINQTGVYINGAMDDNPGTGGGAYSVFADVTADGSINALDLAAARQRLNNPLPAGEPALVAAAVLA